VHDVTCLVCTELKGNGLRAQRGFSEDEPVVRVADNATAEGLAFAARHAAGEL
jgi:hypothetical protein